MAAASQSWNWKSTSVGVMHDLILDSGKSQLDAGAVDCRRTAEIAVWESRNFLQIDKYDLHVCIVRFPIVFNLTFGIFKSKLSGEGAFHRVAFQTDEVPPPGRRTAAAAVGHCLDGSCRVGALTGRDEVIAEVGSDGISLTLLPFQNVVEFMKSLMRRSISSMVDESCDCEKVAKLMMI